MRQGNVLLSMSVCVCAFERMVLIGMGTCNNLMVLCCNGINSLVVVFFFAPGLAPNDELFFCSGPVILLPRSFLTAFTVALPRRKKAITAAVQHKKGQWVSWIEYKQIIWFYIRGLLINHHTSFNYRDA